MLCWSGAQVAYLSALSSTTAAVLAIFLYKVQTVAQKQKKIELAFRIFPSLQENLG